MGFIISNIKYGNLIPDEDYFFEQDNIYCVADGITRDPNIPNNVKLKTIEEALKYYPNPSGATLAAKTFCNSFAKFLPGKLSYSENIIKEAFIYSNQQINKINEKYIRKCDYLVNDYYGCVAVGLAIKNNFLYWGIISDCGLSVYDEKFNLKFKNPDYMMGFSNYTIPEIKEKNLDWIKDSECRVIVRKDYRNQPNKFVNGTLVSYGALTGEKSSIPFIHTGKILLNQGDYVFLYSDGFENLMQNENFINHLLNNFKNDEKIIEYAQQLAKGNYNKYGKERTLIKIKIN